MENDTRIPVELFDKWGDSFDQDLQAKAISNAIITNGVTPSFLNYQSRCGVPNVFSIDTGMDEVTDQGDSMRCWAFASLNITRTNIQRKLQIKEKNFELSQNYIYFYDQLEKSWDFLTFICDTAEKSLKDPMLYRRLSYPIEDNGQWFRFENLAEKYGVVPKYVYPDTRYSFDTRVVTRVLSSKLRYEAKQLRQAAQQGNAKQLDEKKKEALSGIYGILCRFLGRPPVKFDFEYRNTAGQFCRLEEMTPQKFFYEYGYKEQDVMIIHHPSDTMPFEKTYVFDGFAENERKGPQVLLNLDIDDIRALVIRQLSMGDGVVFGADVRRQNSKADGYMDSDLYDYETIFHTSFAMSKKDRILYKELAGTHIMTFTGVNLDKNAKPDRWKVQNSYGKEMGINGFYICMDNWFGDYVTSVTIHKSLLPERLSKLFDEEATLINKRELY